MYKKIVFLIISSFVFSACNQQVNHGEELAKKWCECNKALVPLQQQLEAVDSPGQRQKVLDEMRLIAAEAMRCMGGEAAIVKLDQEMDDIEKDEFNKTFRRVREESCPEVFQAISQMEEKLK